MDHKELAIKVKAKGNLYFYYNLFIGTFVFAFGFLGILNFSPGLLAAVLLLASISLIFDGFIISNLQSNLIKISFILSRLEDKLHSISRKKSGIPVECNY